MKNVEREKYEMNMTKKSRIKIVINIDFQV